MLDDSDRGCLDDIMYRDEGPSPDDIDRFGDSSGYCPDCGAEVWDDVEVCPVCGSPIGGQVLHRHPETDLARKRMIIVTVVATLIGFLLVCVGLYRLL
jgi:hypothetical protein